MNRPAASRRLPVAILIALPIVYLYTTRLAGAPICLHHDEVLAMNAYAIAPASPRPVFLSTDLQWLDAFRRFYIVKHARPDLGNARGFDPGAPNDTVTYAVLET